MTQELPACHPLVAGALPEGYRRRTVNYDTMPPGKVSVASYWSGGSRDSHLLIRNGQRLDIGRSPGFPRFVDPQFELLPGDVYVRHGVFCGKPSKASVRKVV